MKKIICILVVVSLLITVALADSTTYDGEILFRGLPWGCSIDEAVDNIKEIGIAYDLVLSDQDIRGLDYRLTVDDCGFLYEPSYFPSDFYVGGHLVDCISVKAIYGITDGRVSTDRADSHVYSGTYYFKDQVNCKEVYADLVSKLTQIYGEPCDFEESLYDYNKMWTGTNNSAVIIEMKDNIMRPLLHITYVDLTIDDMIKEMQVAAYTGDISSTDGL